MFSARSVKYSMLRQADSARQFMAEHRISNIIIELDLPDESGDALLEFLKSEYKDEMPLSL